MSFNPEIIIHGARVVDNQICYPEKHEFEVKKLFDSRYNLYRDCYYHRVTQSHECLILDILQQTNGILYNYLEAIVDAEQFLMLEDSIVHEVRISDDPRLEKARRLVDRLDRRQLYSFVGEKGLSKERAKTVNSVTEQDVIDAYRQSESVNLDLQVTDIVVRKFNINMGMKDKNPLT